MKLLRHLTVTLLALTPIAALAGTITPPAECAPFLTVQLKSCLVVHHWRCQGEPAGNHWALSINAQGPSFLQQLDNEFRWLQAVPLNDGFGRQLVEPEPDPNSLTELFATRRDDFDFRQDVTRGGKVVRREHVWGYDALTGERVVIDGEELLVTDFQYTVTSNDGLGRVKTSGNQYVSERFRLFFQGRETEVTAEGSREFDDAPVQFIEPGEKGFLSDTPQYGCDAMMSEVEFPERNNG